MVVQPNKAIVGDNAFAHESGIHQDGLLKEKTTYEIMSPESVGISRSTLVMGKHSGRHAFRERLKEMGYELNDADLNKAFEKFKLLADRKKEVKDERKQAEGDPVIKSKIRSAQIQMALKRMASAIPKADVVVTNPTHYAVALKYDRKSMHAPKVVAKGADYIALKIKEIAKINKIPIVEDRSLARTLYKTVDVGKEIPQKLYYAVAKVLSYVYGLKK